MKVGEVVGNLVVLSFSHKKGKNRYFDCECRNCGNVSKKARSNLAAKKELGKRGTCKHCKSDKHPLYSTWKSMINRCHNPNNSGYKSYGGRGITVCSRWRDSFWDFLDDMGDKPSGYTLERVDNNIGYSKGNCVWATKWEQGRNTRKNIWIDYNGVFVTEAELSRLTGTPRTTIQARRRRGIQAWEDLVNET